MRVSPHLTTFVLPGHIVQHCSVVNKGIQFPVKQSGENSFITDLKRRVEETAEAMEVYSIKVDLGEVPGVGV